MIIQALDLPEIRLLQAHPIADARGFFARTLDYEVMRKAGMVTSFSQESVARNTVCGTIRGLHYQRDPHGETKLIQCVRGRIFDVVVDVRPDSDTFGRWISIELDAERPQALYVPSGFAHGYQTLEDLSDVYYHITPDFEAQAAAGINAFSPKLDVPWPLPVAAMSDRDRALAEFR